MVLIVLYMKESLNRFVRLQFESDVSDRLNLGL